jgi:hypothetical protein
MLPSTGASTLPQGRSESPAAPPKAGYGSDRRRSKGARWCRGGDLAAAPAQQQQLCPHLRPSSPPKNAAKESMKAPGIRGRYGENEWNNGADWWVGIGEAGDKPWPATPLMRTYHGCVTDKPDRSIVQLCLDIIQINRVLASGKSLCTKVHIHMAPCSQQIQRMYKTMCCSHPWKWDGTLIFHRSTNQWYIFLAQDVQSSSTSSLQNQAIHKHSIQTVQHLCTGLQTAR